MNDIVIHPICRTGRYRVRKGWFGKSILQEYMTYGEDYAKWTDVGFNYAPPELRGKP